MRGARTLDASILSRANGVEAEILQEKVGALQRIGGKLEAALHALRAHDAAVAPGGGAEREELLRAAGEALWFYVVQREVCGIRDVDPVLREMNVPRDVYLRMGPRGGGPPR